MTYSGTSAHLRVPAAAALHPEPVPATARDKRIAIVSASIGAGHDGAAAELARRLTSHGFVVDRFDLLDLLPVHLGQLVRDSYHRMLVRAPWAYQRVYRSTERAGGGGPLARALLRTAEERVFRTLHPDTGAVVSTYPGASRVLGSLRLRGRLTVPVLTYLTDFSVHPLWVADGVDVHLAAHAVPAAQARAAGAQDVRVSGPVVDPRFCPGSAVERHTARARFGLPGNTPLALLVAGSWGVGPVRQVALELRDCGAAVPVVVCGRNKALAERLRADGIEHAFGWVDDMPALMQAADVLVQNAGGLSSLEAFATGLPVASYRCIPGHGLTNAAALEEAGAAVWIRDPARLKVALCDLIHGPLGLSQRAIGFALFTAEGEGGPAAEIGRIHSAVSPPQSPRFTAPRHHPAARRLVATTAVACGVWACAVGTGIATAYEGSGVIHAIGHSLDRDDPPPHHIFHVEGHHHS
ncbi:MGDG synthase family glycosyltransferase [Streptomyces sp. NBC_00588]|jgi:UDP-N-acetylglucosamine:LPS N-acetylglucosamine transferase|uniref:MGDG synthase family glycosyltransferase n=1 Tax=Streptomyces sp. NBC_00588 TaxID=2975784 RepID=UPI002E8196D8|nr:glycosyltransferase [Streptomyces sp. NBC_00588]WUB41279.1 glycosyltransferase [Streptomyces sp. NBC_00588]